MMALYKGAVADGSGLWYGQVDSATGESRASEFGALHASLPGVLALGSDPGPAGRLQESCFNYHYTKDPRNLEMGRTFLEGPTTPFRTEAGYAVLNDVLTKEQRDLTPSYFLAETLGYVYLLFTPENTVDFDRVVLNICDGLKPT